MKKLAFLLGLVVMTTSLAFAQSHYTQQGDGTYAYAGDTVDAINIDFTSWELTDLPSALSDEMPLAEVTKDGQSYGFVKWKIASYTSGGVTQNVLFNNNTGDEGVTIPNNTSTNPPAIYFPTTSRKIDSIAINSFTANYWLSFNWIDADGPHAVSKKIEAAGISTFEINSNGPTTLYILYKMTTWPRIKSIDVFVEGAPTPVMEVSLDVDKTQLQVGDSITVHATVLPDDATDKTVTWESDAPGIASVNENGVVTGIAPGTAHITAKAGNKSASCEIEVKDLVIHATGIEWDVVDKSFEMTLGDSLQVAYKILPENATEREVILMSDNKYCVRVTPQGKLFADGGGTAHIIATLLDFSDTLTVFVDDPNMPKGELDWDQDGTYWGDSVNYVYENFNEWPLSALRNPITSEDIQQYKKLGFIRWELEPRATLIGVQQWDNTDIRTSLFTNNPEIDGHRTTDSAHYAYIYLPTLKLGAGAIRITGYASTSNGNPIGMQLAWYNEQWSEEMAGYTFIKSIQIPADGTNIVETSIDIEEPVTLQIAYHQSVWPSLWSIQVSPYGYPLSDDPDTDFADLGEGLEDVYGGVKALKMMVNGQIIIVKNGKTYTVLGTPVELK